MQNIEFQNFEVFLLVFVRMSGMILFNPIFSRRNVPMQVKMGFVLCLTVLIAPTINTVHIIGFSEVEIIFAIFKELFVGFICGLVFQIFYQMLFFAGDFLDIQFGLSMAKVFDPGANVQMSLNGNLLNTFFILYIFASDCHLLLIKIFASSYLAVPIGTAIIGGGISSFILNLFISVFTLALKLTLPFVIAVLTVEIAVGILMKLIPQIHVFVINIQLKLFFGLLLMLLFTHPISAFIDSYMTIMFENMGKVLSALN